MPVILTFAPCASEKTLAFMQWLGDLVRALAGEQLKHSSDSLTTSLRLCEATFDELFRFARSKHVPLGVNVESVSIRKAEIEASVTLFESLRRRMRSSTDSG